MTTPKIVIYTTPTCPDCLAVVGAFFVHQDQLDGFIWEYET